MSLDRKKRPRRIAADEAHAWARNLRLNNSQAKLVLSMLTLYVDGDGYCFVGIPSLAEDTELSAQTVRRRLAWLEELGAIVRVPQWVDDKGVRNSDGRGKRTSDLIRLCIDADEESIEARGAGLQETEPTASDPTPRIGSPEAENSAGPTAALPQPSHCGEGLISEPEPESPLKSPPGTREALSHGEDSEPEHFAPAWNGWRGHEVMRRDLALNEFRQLPAEKQLLCRAAVPLFWALQDKLGRKHAPNFNIWIKSRGFEEFPNAKLALNDPPPRRFVTGDELTGYLVAWAMADRPGSRLVDDPLHGRGFWTSRPPQPDLAALAKFHDDDPARWPTAQRGTPQCAAWCARLELWLGGDVEPRKVFLEPFVAAVHGLPPSDPNFKFRKSQAGLPVPAPFPPKRDGTWSQGVPPMTTDDLDALASEGQR